MLVDENLNILNVPKSFFTAKGTQALTAYELMELIMCFNQKTKTKTLLHVLSEIGDLLGGGLSM